MTDPIRWRDPAGGAAAPIRELLEAAHQDLGSDAEVAELAARLGPVLSPAAPPGGAAAPAQAAAGALLGKGLAGLAVLGAVAAGLVLGRPADGDPPAAPQPTGRDRAGASPAPTPGSEAAAAPPTVAAPPPALREVAASRPEEPAPRQVPASPAPAAPNLQTPPPAGETEGALLARARAALGRDAAAALALTREHAARFPRAMLGEEREVLAIEALVALGRRDEASARATRLLAADPGSAYRRRLEGLLAR